MKIVAEIRHTKMSSFPISQNQQQQHLTSASLKRRKRRSTQSAILLLAFLFFFLVEILPVVRAFSFLKSSFNTRAVVNLDSNSSMSDLVKEEEKHDAILAEDSSSVKAEIDATTSLIAKKAKEMEQTLKLFERQRMDLHPPSKEEKGRGSFLRQV